MEFLTENGLAVTLGVVLFLIGATLIYLDEIVPVEDESSETTGLMFFSGDTETTGLDPKNSHLLEVSFIRTWHGDKRSLQSTIEDGDVFHCYLDLAENELSEGDEYALNMNKKIIQRIRDKEPGFTYLKKEEVLPNIREWLDSKGFEGAMTVAGKNFAGFDMPFLKELPNYSEHKDVFGHRVIDPTMYFVDWVNDKKLPNLSKCLSRTEHDNIVSHTATEDSWQVIQLLRAVY